MKKVVLVLAMLVAAPAFALTVDCNDLGGGIVAIEYNGADPCNLPCAFALAISVDNGVEINDVNSYKMDGESVNPSKGYGIYPGTVDLNDVNVPVWGTPVAPSSAPDEPCQPPADNIIIEMGALYSGDANAPDVDGTLCKIILNDKGAASCTMTVKSDPLRVCVLEDGSSFDVNSSCPVTFTTPTCWDATECAGQPKGDATCDGSVNFSDLLALKMSFFQNKGDANYNCCADFDQSESVNFSDLLILKMYFFTSGYSPSTLNQNCPP